MVEERDSPEELQRAIEKTINENAKLKEENQRLKESMGHLSHPIDPAEKIIGKNVKLRQENQRLRELMGQMSRPTSPEEKRMSRPISPKEMMDKQNLKIPYFVYEAFNELIIKNISHGCIAVTQKEVVALIKTKMIDPTVFDDKWLNIENVYSQMGWHVLYIEPVFIFAACKC